MKNESSENQRHILQLAPHNLLQHQQEYELEPSHQTDTRSADNAFIAHRVERLEAIVNYLVNRLDHLTTQSFEKQNGIESGLERERIEPNRSGSHVSTPSITPSPSQLSTVLTSEAWEEGLVTKDLVVRLQTNPSTLKKYLRDLKQIQWAVERDPDKLGWVYDSLLERYYPAQMGSVETDAIETSMLPNADRLEPVTLQPVQNDRFVTELASVHCNKFEYRDGLTQSGLSRLTGIPITTLQRWKDLADCPERIRCRTEGMYIYWYSRQNRRFYPFRVSSKGSMSPLQIHKSGIRATR